MSVAIQPQHKLHIMMRTTIGGELVKLMSIGTRGTTLHRFGRLQEGSAMTWPTIWTLQEILKLLSASGRWKLVQNRQKLDFFIGLDR
jgi:hypothetical protein